MSDYPEFLNAFLTGEVTRLVVVERLESLNLRTIRALTDAFDRGGRKAIDKAMKNQPALFLKMLVLCARRGSRR